MTDRRTEWDFPPGHPGRGDYDAASPDAIEWARVHVSPLGERAFPVDHPAAPDTPGNLSHLAVRPGVDPVNPHLEPFTGRTPAQVAGIRALSEAASKAATESPVLQPIDFFLLNPMLLAKRAKLERDTLTAGEYAEVLEDYHATHGADVVAKRKAATLDERTQAVSYVMSRGYSRDVAEQIVDKEGAHDILRTAGLVQ